MPELRRHSWQTARFVAAVNQVIKGVPFVHILDESPDVAVVAESNFAVLELAANDKSAAIMVALDNLGKGMAGQAVQAMNIALGLPETSALWSAGRFPA